MAHISAAYREGALRRGVLLKSNSTKPAASQLVDAAVIEFANYGFIVEREDLASMGVTALKDSLDLARKVIGADRELTPIYPGFPEQVQELPTLTLLVEQIFHYWSAGAFIPNYPTVAREGLPLEDMLRNARPLRVLNGAQTAREMIRSLVTNPIALSQDDKNFLRGSLELQHVTVEQITELMTEAVNGENIQNFVVLCAEVCSLSHEELVLALAPLAKSADQLLRLVLALYSEPSSVRWQDNYTQAVFNIAERHARAVKISRMSRPVRRAIVRRAAQLSGGFKADSFLARKELWRRVMRAVHPFELISNDAERRICDILHENVPYRTFNSRVEKAFEQRKVKKLVTLLAENQPGQLLRRAVAILRIVRRDDEALMLADSLRSTGGSARISTLISAYNGVISANDEHARVTRVAGANNSLVSREKLTKVNEKHLELVRQAMVDALTQALSQRPAPSAPVAIDDSLPVPLVHRDASTADRSFERGERFSPVGTGDVLRIFGHWLNDKSSAGYMDIGAVALDEELQSVSVCTWDTWNDSRDWATYSGDKYVKPGDSAAEYVDVDVAKLRKSHPSARWVAMTVQSWSGWPIDSVDFLAGAMLRSSAQAGEVFDPRTVATAFKLTTGSTQAVAFVLDMESGELIWLDSSNGSTAAHTSSSYDGSIGTIVYDELLRPRLTMGELAKLWAHAHGVETVLEPVRRELLMSLLD